VEEIRKYIESGILELYVLGDLSVEEKAEVEAMAALHPEVKAELDDIELALGSLANSYAEEPSAEVKEAFFSKIKFNDTIAEQENIDPSAGTDKPLHRENSVIIPINNSRLNFYKYSFAACLTLLLLSFAAIFTLYNSLQNSKQELAVLQGSNQDFANRVNLLENEMIKASEALEIYSNPDFKMVELKGTANSPESKMTVAFNPVLKKVMIDMKSISMPEHDEKHQYQLWALVDGKPVDLGVFDADQGESGLKNMKSLQNAQAFAVTLEPKGGSINPTMDKMMVMGAI